MDSRSLAWVWSIRDCFVWSSDWKEDWVFESRVDNAADIEFYFNEERNYAYKSSVLDCFRPLC